MTMPHDPTEPTRMTPRRSRPNGNDDQAAERAALSRLVAAKPGAGETDDEDDQTYELSNLGPIQAPTRVSVVLPCPSCGQTNTVVAAVFARVTKDSDGKGAIALRIRAPKVEHVCGQMPLGLVEGPLAR
jgi:hypothetical protein